MGQLQSHDILFMEGFTGGMEDGGVGNGLNMGWTAIMFQALMDVLILK